MKSTGAPVALLLALLARGTSAADPNPISKVLHLLSDLQSKIVADGVQAQKIYEECADFCEDRSRHLGFEIKTEKSEKARLEAAIAQETALLGSLSAKIEELSASIASDEAELKAASAIRAKEAKTFAAQERELTEAIDVLGRATAILEREMQEGKASMLQLQSANNVAQALGALVQAAGLGTADGERLTAMLQERQQASDADEDAGTGAPDPDAYESHSGGIVSTLEGLSEKAGSQLSGLQKAEADSLHNFNLLKQSLEDSITFAKKEMDKAKKGTADCGERKATAEGALSVASKDLAALTKSLADLHQDCMAKAADFEATTKSRNDEMKALTEATKVIAETTGGAETVQYGAGEASLLQVAAGAAGPGPAAVRAVRGLARSQHSQALAQLAAGMASALRAQSGAGEDPFAKVKALVTDMIARLEDEADADASHKAFCDRELAEANLKKEDKANEVEKLSTKIDQMASRSAQLRAEVAALQKALSELASSQAEMDRIRRAEHEEYVKSKADLQEGLEGVKVGLKILRSYYAQGDKAHLASEGAGSSIIGLLEVVESDLSKSIVGSTEAEDSAQSTYEKETKENEIEKTMKDQDVKYKSKEAGELDQAMAEAQSDRTAVQAELDAVLESLTSLDKQCIDKPSSYEERKQRREAEIAGLRESLSTLESVPALLQTNAGGALRGAHGRRSAKGSRR